MHLPLELIDMCFSYLCDLTERGLSCLVLFECLLALFKSMEVHLSFSERTVQLVVFNHAFP